ARSEALLEPPASGGRADGLLTSTLRAPPSPGGDARSAPESEGTSASGGPRPFGPPPARWPVLLGGAPALRGRDACDERRKALVPHPFSGYENAATGDWDGRGRSTTMSEYSAWFECINGCPTRFSLFEIIYRCPTCGDLLDVVHDVNALRRRSPAAWMKLFDERYRRNDFPYGSGVWGKKEWVVPFLDNENIVSTYEGGTNLLWAERYGRVLGVEDLWVKQCGNSHTGSFKDLGMTVLVSVVKQMIAEGQQIAAIVCASTGDTSAALANYCAAAGIPAVVLLPRNKVSPAQLVQPLANGALVLSLNTDFDGCMALVQEITKERTVYLANSMNSLRIEGQKTVAIELVQQFNWEIPDWVVIPGGNLGNVSALGKGFLMMRDLGLIQKLPRIAVAQAANANPLYLSFLNHLESLAPGRRQKTRASAIRIATPGGSNRPTKVLRGSPAVAGQPPKTDHPKGAAV